MYVQNNVEVWLLLLQTKYVCSEFPVKNMQVQNNHDDNTIHKEMKEKSVATAHYPSLN